MQRSGTVRQRFPWAAMFGVPGVREEVGVVGEGDLSGVDFVPFAGTRLGRPSLGCAKV